ncbi:MULTISPECIES: hypothetical protein [unclassified Rathayibacter]|uniref:hypothetical protein n=1 Tax=unclassified Rathayibacter TaxID=2609250 RepID=UPI000FBABE97|nr:MULTISPECIES: hypothetical protein [unclassified Rathayibacter]ROP49801.1 hypothetical protein EDF45_2359 [Rathayibacter sp. PhB186]ROS51705.1 hypothetical protein EDF44_2039 [Rathayibacter sp. PhB185]
MARRRVSERAQALLLRHPWTLAVLSGVFVAMIVVLAADVGWDPAAVVGGGRRHAPLWLVAGIGLPFFGIGVVVGVVKQVQLVRRRRAPVSPSPEVEQLRRDGPGWLSRREDEAREREESVVVPPEAVGRRAGRAARPRGPS